MKVLVEIVLFTANGTSTTSGEEAVAVNNAVINLGDLSTPSVVATGGVGVTNFSGMIATNSGQIKNTKDIIINEKQSIGMVVMGVNTSIGLTSPGKGEMSGGNIIVTDDPLVSQSIAVANFGTFNQTGGTIDVSGKIL